MEDSNQIVIFGESSIDLTLEARIWPTGDATYFQIKSKFGKASIILNLEQTRELKEWLDVNIKRYSVE